MWCSDECVKRYTRIGSWGGLTGRIHTRDRNTCRLCGGGGLVASCMQREFVDTAGNFHPALTRLVSQFQVDHILPVHDGGTDDPANLRLLCVPCHKLVTALWLGRRARSRTGQKTLF